MTYHIMELDVTRYNLYRALISPIKGHIFSQPSQYITTGDEVRPISIHTIHNESDDL